MNTCIIYLLNDEPLVYSVPSTPEVHKLHNRIVNVDDMTDREINYLENINTVGTLITTDFIDATLFDRVVITGWF